jgi:hypothetical protein
MCRQGKARARGYLDSGTVRQHAAPLRAVTGSRPGVSLRAGLWVQVAPFAASDSAWRLLGLSAALAGA